MAKQDNPVKIIRTSDADYRPPQTPGGGQKVFGDGASRSRRELLASQSAGLLNYFGNAFNQWPGMPAVGKVTLKEEALAKSHRPDGLFSATSCPIIGTLGYGELLISVTRRGVTELQRRLLQSKGKKRTANISTVEHIEPYTEEERISAYLTSHSEAGMNRPIKIRVFDHQEDTKNAAIHNALSSFLSEQDIPAKPLNYGDGNIYVINNKGYSEITEKLSGFVGLRSVSPMPSFRALNYMMQMTAQGQADPACCPPPDPEVDYPVVGIIDSGICPSNTLLAPWITARETYVPPGSEDYAHGTMVAGLISNPQQLNHGDARFPSTQAMLIDVNVFAKDEDISEEVLIEILNEMVPKYPEVRVWNLSLGSASPSDLFDFSDFATVLDRLHDRFGCLFVVAAGNQNDVKAWPTSIKDPVNNRISSPADSIRALTVGSVAHLKTDQSLCEINDSSPFSRIGPGPCHIPKPEVTHFGGNATPSGSYAQQGVLSLGPDDVLMESIGTSFAAPIASSIAANLYHFLAQNSEITITAEQVKAFMVHSAMLGPEQVDTSSINHKGFGVPGDLIDNLYCDSDCITMVFEADVRHGGFEFERFPMPIPPCLLTEDGKFRGEMLMTLVYSPLVNESFASEYCRTNVEVGLGSYHRDANGKMKFDTRVPLAPKDFKDMYEIEQIKNGFKWSPVKAYHQKFPRGVAVNTWRLKMKVTRRAEEPMPDAPQRAVLLISIRGLNGEGQVYNETVQEMNQIGWSSVDVDQHVRITPRAQG